MRKPKTIRFVTADSPSANGRDLHTGDQCWNIGIPLENGDTLVIEIGKAGRDALLEALKIG